ncbi:YheC/YheD family protein [Heliorestis convoluta]|uniref:YheC/YheD family protein, putative n=1 Tax=Heliorestis convoluta TaxID=356322 RepID=A0A5Q2N735_9FIRM|nr:YheC/YheD family protein [Heliorestis convoluta]QGG48080.1 YheC/YheD family protein, putative [Heliorestis convoluta]
MLSDKSYMFSILKENKDIIKHLPETVPYSINACCRYLKDYGVAILKPVQGTSGTGIIKVKVGYRHFIIDTKSKRFILDKAEDLLNFLEKKINGKPYLIQEYIDRLKINNRFFDIRVILQKKDSNWKLTGWFGQLTSKTSFLSNTSAGGSIIPLEASLQNHLRELTSENIITELQHTALQIVQQLDKHFPHKHLWGLDLAINRSGQILLIEVSSYPDLSKFKNKKLDPAMLRTIKSYL